MVLYFILLYSFNPSYRNWYIAYERSREVPVFSFLCHTLHALSISKP